MTIKHYWPGRVFAHSYEEAQVKAAEFVRNKGAEPVGEIRPFPCLSQHRAEIWYEFYAEVRRPECAEQERCKKCEA